MVALIILIVLVTGVSVAAWVGLRHERIAARKAERAEQFLVLRAERAACMARHPAGRGLVR